MTGTAIDLGAAALAEYRRRYDFWRKAKRDAATSTDAARILTQGQADLDIWHDIAEFFVVGLTPAKDSRPMARSARATLDVARESGKASDEKIVQLCAITRKLETHVGYRHGWDQPETARKAA